jgi:hypothetical protein
MERKYYIIAMPCLTSSKEKHGIVIRRLWRPAARAHSEGVHAILRPLTHM